MNTVFPMYLLHSTRSFSRFSRLGRCSFRGLSKLANLKVGEASPTGPANISISEEIITKLEKASLVGFDREHSVAVLKEAINFAERLRTVEIDESVKPMYSPLENEHIQLREDEVTEGNNAQAILKNASVVQEEYFVTPLKSNVK